MIPSNHPHLLDVNCALGSTSFKSRNQSKSTFLPLFPVHRRRPHPSPSHWICPPLATRLLALPAHHPASSFSLGHSHYLPTLSSLFSSSLVVASQGKGHNHPKQKLICSFSVHCPISQFTMFWDLSFWVSSLFIWVDSRFLVGPQQLYFSL